MRIEIVNAQNEVRGWIEVDGSKVTHDEFGGELLDQPALRELAGLDDAQIAQTLTTWSNGYGLHARVADGEPVAAALGHDVTPGHDELHHYWTRDPEGLAKWADSPTPWTTLVAHLTRHVGPERAKVFASRWFHEVFGFYAGSDLNRVTHGHPPRGHNIGPG